MLDESFECFYILLYIMMIGIYKFKNKLLDWVFEFEGINNEKVEKNVCYLDVFFVGCIDG